MRRSLIGVVLVFLACCHANPAEPASVPFPKVPKNSTCGKFIYNPTNINRTIDILSFSGKHFNDMGEYHQCMDGDKEFTPDEAVFCRLDFIIDFVGLCIPKACENEIPTFVDWLNQQLDLTKDTDITYSCGNHSREDWNAGAIIFLIFCAALFGLVAVATYSNIEETDKEDSYMAMNVDPPRNRVMTELMSAFSLQRTMNELLHRSPTRKYRALDGFRAFSMLWVILGHTANFMMFVGIENSAEYFPPNGVASRPSFMFFAYGANFAVDTFFWLSGFLSALVMYRKKEKGHQLPFPLLVLHRFLRLMVVYGFIICGFVLVAPNLSSGPFWDLFYGTAKNCEDKWWTNLLFINNLWPKDYKDQCMAWTWYLANDMQFFIVGIPLVSLVFKYPRLGAATMAFIVLTNLLINGLSTSHYDFYALSTDPSDTTLFQNKLYDKPWARITPYIFGMGMAFVLCRSKKTLELNSTCSRLCVMVLGLGLLGFINSLCGIAMGYMTSFPGNAMWGRPADYLFNIFARFGWSVGLSLVAALCVTDQGGIIEYILSFGFWDPIGKLTYSAYLLHPIIIRGFYFSRVESITYSDGFYVIHYLAFAALSYGMATVMYCVVESPFGYLSRLLTQGRKGN